MTKSPRTFKEKMEMEEHPFRTKEVRNISRVQCRPMPLAFACIILLFFITGCFEFKHTKMVPMRDGVKLATDVYLPAGEGPWPVILYRTPYGKDEFNEQGMGFARIGIVAVGQDMRGRFLSQGKDGVFTTDGDGDLKDGFDTIEWISQQGWCNGKIGTTGGSARGIVQYMQNSTGHPNLVVMNPGVATPNLYTDAMFNRGVFRDKLICGWLGAQQSLDFLDNVYAHPYEDAFWDPVQTADQYGNVQTPGLHEGGWYDIFLQGTLDGFTGYQHSGGTGAAGNQKVIIGPWTHGGFGSLTQGELTYPANSITPPYASGEAFNTLFNHYLEFGSPDVTDLPDDVPNVQYYVMGDVDDPVGPGNVWRQADDWPPAAAPVRMHLHPDGSLAESCPPEDGGVTPYTYDPANPSPTICGNNLNMAAGSCDQQYGVEDRADVILFSTPVLAQPMEITGRVRAHIFADIDQPDTDIMVRMTDVYPDGRSMLISDSAARMAARNTTTGITLLSPNEVVETVVDLWSTSIIINTGHRLRISITSSNSPRFAVNQNTGLDFPGSAWIVQLQGADGITGTPVTVNIHHSLDYPSYLEIPDPNRTHEDYIQCN